MSESIQCYGCGTRTTLTELVKNQDDCPECGAQHSLNDVAKALELNSRAQSAPEPVQGEAVRVVGWADESGEHFVSHDCKAYGEAMGGAAGSAVSEYTEAVMTVAQHNRILAAASAKRGEAVAWQVTTGCALPAVYDKYPDWAVGDPTLAIVPLYTAAAKPDDELVALLKEAREFAAAAYVNNTFFGPSARKTLARIDAKLAELQK